MSGEAIVTIVGGSIAALGLIFVIIKKLPKRVKSPHYTRKWRELQRLCADKETWPNAIIDADNLVDEVLKKKRKNGKTKGERLVSAGDDFSSNDALWNAHKLAGKLETDANSVKLKENDVKEALVAFRQALRDLGAL